MARICMIAYSDYISDSRIRREAESLSERGDEVDCICLPHGNRAEEATLNGVHLYPLDIRRYRGQSTLQYMLSYIRFFLKTFLLVTSRYLRIHYDLIQVHTMPDFMVFAALVPRLLGVAVILDVHDLMPELYISKFHLDRNHPLIRAITFIERASIRFAHQAIAVHRPHLKALVSHHNPPEKFEIVMNTPDPAIFVRRKPRRGNRSCKLVYHGTVSRRHGLELAIRAVARAQNEIGNLELSIIGDGDDLDRLVRLSTELGLEGSVTFTRRSVPVSALPALLSDADIGLVPFQRDDFTRYMLPVKLMEYVALGIPVIATRTTTIQGYFDDSMIRYINGDSVEELARAIIDLNADPMRCAKMVASAEDFAQRYHWDTQKLVYHRIIDALVARKSRASFLHRPGARVKRPERLRQS
jgi:glycosyltransferase involved in cell wall biosynthesis